MNSIHNGNIDSFFEDIITSYEARIQKIQTAFQSSEYITESYHSLFEHVHNTLTDLKKDREIINSKLCESLAKNGSLRKKDCNALMASVLTSLDEKEKNAESQFLKFVEAQKEIAQSLKTGLLSIKDIASQDSNQKITIFKDQLSQISKLQEMRKQMVIKTFTDFQNIHNKIMESLKNLLEKGDQVLAKDIKSVKNQLVKEIN